ncbi:hypothetical protein [Umezawaea tangerina]|uniref:Uncharacterized protein n=1 Tax=Umezawaea tangerina TaxID=84725 RepID=A0A2T0T428_9PSEU|nr:hypothetical protein [Umezawaea tangerina]PRY40435.1 hypothetical protein CLV43_106170 [Umezawaea tangerina]
MSCTEEDDDRPTAPAGTRNSIGGVVSGNVVQAAVIHGGVHFGGPAPPVRIPRQLPHAPAHFTGRGRESTAFDRTVAEAVGRPALVVVCGTGGVGTGDVGAARSHLQRAAALYARSSGPQAEHVRARLDRLDHRSASSPSEPPETTQE